MSARKVVPKWNSWIIESIKKSNLCVTIEDGIITGGLGSSIKQLIVDSNLKNIRIKSFAYPDQFIEHGSTYDLEKKYEMDTIAISKYIEENIE